MTATPQSAIIALGSNQGDSLAILHSALEAMQARPDIHILKCSSFYQTKPIGYLKQADFINAVCEIQTLLSPMALLEVLHTIERQFKRVRVIKDGPRTLDLDLIDFSHLTLHNEILALPHPRAHERNFVMTPLAEILPQYPIHHLKAIEYKKNLEAQAGQTVILIKPPPPINPT